MRNFQRCLSSSITKNPFQKEMTIAVLKIVIQKFPQPARFSQAIQINDQQSHLRSFKTI